MIPFLIVVVLAAITVALVATVRALRRRRDREADLLLTRQHLLMDQVAGGRPEPDPEGHDPHLPPTETGADVLHDVEELQDHARERRGPGT